MKIRTIKDEGKQLQIEFDTSDVTVPDLIASRLLMDSDVQFAGVSKDHPETGKPILSLKTEKKKPKDELLKALESIEESLDEIKEQLSKKK
jgi:DNA-directed RNA polymerase subunit L